ncbi:mitochondrial intermembrane space import and assembly protein 40 isoform X1 [Chroicocephalus ridibundus]|uniref:mitochondrial intermembrane space import and assembly protein 40 isoform X1 n=1 Tax=Chroicocephalus ridibundus TaxID=1192867 RepID=UPI002FDED547
MPGRVVPAGRGAAGRCRPAPRPGLRGPAAPSRGPPPAGGASAAAGGQGRRFRRREVRAWSSAPLSRCCGGGRGGAEGAAAAGSVCGERHRTAPSCPTAGKKEKTELYLRPRRTMRHQAVLSWLQMTQMTLMKNKHRRNKRIRLCGPIPCHAGMHAKIPRSLPSRG